MVATRIQGNKSSTKNASVDEVREAKEAPATGNFVEDRSRD